MNTCNEMHHSYHGDTIRTADEHCTPAEVMLSRTITCNHEEFHTNDGVYNYPIGKPLQQTVSSAANGDVKSFESAKTTTTTIEQVHHGDAEIITDDLHESNSRRFTRDILNVNDIRYNYGTEVNEEEVPHIQHPNNLVRHQPDPSHCDPVDFQNSSDALCHVREKILKFLLEIEHGHEAQLRYNPSLPEMNANNFTWVLQSRGATSSGPSSNMVNYETSMIRLLQRKDEMSQNVPLTHHVVVRIGYHYTTSERIQHQIQYQGFSKQAPPPSAMANEFVFPNINITGVEGPKTTSKYAICTSGNPFTYHQSRETDQCILVLYLTIVPKKITDEHIDAMLNSTHVVPSSDCAIPLMKFSSDLIETPLCNFFGDDTISHSTSSCIGNEMVLAYHRFLKTIIDTYWNAESTTSPNLLPSQVTLCNYYDARYCHHRQKNTDQCILPTSAYSVHYIAPKVALFQSLLPTLNIPSQWECAICLNNHHHDSVSNTRTTGSRKRLYNHTVETVSLINCSHVFHRECIHEYAHRTSNFTCPLCRAPISKIDDLSNKKKKYRQLGTMPSGVMQIEICCDLFVPDDIEPDPKYDGAICITYRFLAGVQKDYHRLPNQRYDSATYIMYIPNCIAGQELLECLRYGFVQGHLFTINSSCKIVPLLSGTTCHRIDKQNPYCDHSKLNPFRTAGRDGNKGHNRINNTNHEDYMKRIHIDLETLTVPPRI